MTPPSVNEMDPYFSTHCTWRTYLVENSDYDPTHQGKYTPTQLYVTKNSIFISRYRPCTTQIRHTMWRCICILVRFCAFQSSMFSSSLDLFQIRKHTAEGTASVSVCVNVGGEGCGASLASPLSRFAFPAPPGRSSDWFYRRSRVRWTGDRDLPVARFSRTLENPFSDLLCSWSGFLFRVISETEAGGTLVRFGQRGGRPVPDPSSWRKEAPYPPPPLFTGIAHRTSTLFGLQNMPRPRPSPSSIARKVFVPIGIWVDRSSFAPRSDTLRPFLS